MVKFNFLPSDSEGFMLDGEAFAYLHGVLRSRELLFRSSYLDDDGSICFNVEVRA